MISFIHRPSIAT